MMTMGKSRALCDTREPEPQPGSLFLSKLPPEIRHQIYDHVFGHRHLHIFVYERRLVCLACLDPTAVEPEAHEPCIGMSLSGSQRPWSDEGLKQQQQQPQQLAPSSDSSSSDGLEKKDCQGLAALLTVCRTMYFEMADSLYRTHVFHFSNLISMTVFPRQMIPRHCNMVHHVRIDLSLLAHGTEPDGLYCFIHNSFSDKWSEWGEEEDGETAGNDTPWEYAWGAIASLKSLRTLRVTIELTCNKDLARNSIALCLERSIFQPLRKVTASNDFLLRVNWPAPSATEEEEQLESEYPFRIERFAPKALN
ncbi:glutamate-cysteine ligase catalytic subunit [Apiospora arundinis]